MRKRALTLALALVMCLTLLPMGSMAVTIEEVVNPKLEYNVLGLFYDGLALVKKGSKWGFIDKTGEVVIPLEYGDVGSFSEGLAAAEKDGKYGFIDKTGKVVIPLEYDNVGGFSEGLAAAEKGKKYGFIDKTGKVVIPLEYDVKYADLPIFKEGFAGVTKDSKCGFIDKTGKVVVPLEYDGAQNFNEGVACVYKDVTKEPNSIFRDCKYGFVDNTGKLVVPLEYDSYSERFSEGLARVFKDGKYGYVDKTGKVVIPIKYSVQSEDFKTDFHEGLAAVYSNQTWKWGFIDKTGKVAIAQEYDNVDDFKDGLAWVIKGGKWGCIDKTGKMVIPLEYDEVTRFSGGIAWVTKDGKGGFIDNTGKIVVPFGKYDGYVYSYPDYSFISEGIACVLKDGKYGILRVSDSGVTPPVTPTPDTVTAISSAQKVTVNGKDVAFDAYNINGNNYFKLRDLAFALTGSEKQFDVGWDGAKNAISLTSGKAYTVVGGELVGKDTGDKTGTPTASKIYLDGKEVSFTAYNIDGNNYFKLRDIGSTFNFGVDFDSATNTVVIDTSKGYTAA